MAIRLIRCANSVEVTPYDDAIVFHSAKGHDYTGNTRGGVFSRVYKQMQFIRDNVNHKFIVQSGQAMLYGRQIEIPQNETIEFEVAEYTNKYCIVYIEVTNALVQAEEEDEEDYDELSVTCNLRYASNAVPSLGNTDLIANRYGTATMPLYSFFVGGDGTIGDVTDLRYIYEPGVVERARMMTSDDVVNNRKLGDLIYDNKDMVKHTDHAYYADRGTSLGTTGTSVTRNKIDDDLYLPNRGAYLLTTQIIPIKTDGSTWANGNETVVSGLPTSVKGNIIHVMVTGTDNTTAVGYLLQSALSQSSSSISFDLICNGEQTVGNNSGAIEISIKVSGGKAKVKPLGRDITGTLYLVLFIAGYK